VVLPHLYSGGTVTLLHPYPPESTRIAGYRRPQRVHFVASLPRNASLKVRKDQLRAELGRREPDGTGAGESS
jgi:hypothetical protein